jgi:hypothetical protein
MSSIYCSRTPKLQESEEGMSAGSGKGGMAYVARGNGTLAASLYCSVAEERLTDQMADAR